MGNKTSAYTSLDEYFDWEEAYIEFRFGGIRIISEFTYPNPPSEAYIVPIPEKVRQQIIDGEIGVAKVFTRNNQCIGNISLNPQYWKRYELDYHPKYYRDYIPYKQRIPGFSYKIRHSIANYPESIVLYRR